MVSRVGPNGLIAVLTVNKYINSKCKSDKHAVIEGFGCTAEASKEQVGSLGCAPHKTSIFKE